MTTTNGDLQAAIARLDPAMLKALGGMAAQTTLVGADNDVQYHDNPAILVPHGMSMEQLAETATKKAAELNKIHNFLHKTTYRPNDGAHAAGQVIKRMFGLTVGKATQSMFGEDPPEFRSIDVAHNRKVEVPWGEMEIPALPGAVFAFHATSGENGPVFAVVVRSPKKHKVKIEEFFNALDHELATNSIYRGHALWGAHDLTFMDTSRFKANEIVFADDVQNTIDAAVFGLIEHTGATIAAGLPTKRCVLAYGPYGTGKSSLGLITAQRATAAGWTFLSAKAGRDELKPVLQTAKLYEPAVVFVEDIDAHTPKAADRDAISEILDLFDGIGSKDSKLIVVLTSNDISKVPAGMLRPGRLDYCVEINGLDRGGVERLIKAVVRHDLLAGDVDYDVVFAEMADWQPAWVRAVADRAQSFAISRSRGALDYGLTTADLVGAARSLQPQLVLMNNALEGFPEPELHVALRSQIDAAVKGTLDGVRVVDSDDDQSYMLRTEPLGGHSWDVPRR